MRRRPFFALTKRAQHQQPCTLCVSCFETLRSAAAGSFSTDCMPSVMTRACPGLAVHLVSKFGHTGTERPGLLGVRQVALTGRADLVQALFAAFGPSLGLSAAPFTTRALMRHAAVNENPAALFQACVALGTVSSPPPLQTVTDVYKEALRTSRVFVVDAETGKISARDVRGNEGAVQALLDIKADLTRIMYPTVYETFWTEACRSNSTDVLPVLARANLDRYRAATPFRVVPRLLVMHKNPRVLQQLLDMGFILQNPEDVLSGPGICLESVAIVAREMTKPGARISPCDRYAVGFTDADTVVRVDVKAGTRFTLVNKTRRQVGFHLSHHAVGRRAGMHKLAALALDVPKDDIVKAIFPDQQDGRPVPNLQARPQAVYEGVLPRETAGQSAAPPARHSLTRLCSRCSGAPST